MHLVDVERLQNTHYTYTLYFKCSSYYESSIDSVIAVFLENNENESKLKDWPWPWVCGLGLGLGLVCLWPRPWLTGLNLGLGLDTSGLVNIPASARLCVSEQCRLPL